MAVIQPRINFNPWKPSRIPDMAFEHHLKQTLLLPFCLLWMLWGLMWMPYQVPPLRVCIDNNLICSVNPHSVETCDVCAPLYV